MRESGVLRRLILACNRGPRRVFRMNAGQLWAGRVVAQSGTRVVLDPAQRVEGVPPGFSDLAGWTTVTITPDMVGQRVAVFTAVEAKSDSGALRPEQRRFLAAVHEAGGVAIVARSADDVLNRDMFRAPDSD